jgi:hypothetical protein
MPVISGADDRYTRIGLHALSAAIPHALLLLHALLDILPYPKGDKGMWYEIRTGSTECVEEHRVGASRSGSKRSSKEEKNGPSNGLAAGKGKGKELATDKADPKAQEAEAGVMDVEQVDEDIEFGDIGGIEEDEPERIAKLKVRLHASEPQLASADGRHRSR